MNDQNSLTINVLDKEYRVACPPGEKDTLTASANMLNQRLSEIKSKGSVIGSERIAIMAALNLSHDALKTESLQNEHEDLNTRIDRLSEMIDNTMRKIKLV